jgi:DNA polymerase-1
MVMIDADERIDKARCRKVLQVHDEIVFEMKPEYRAEVEPIITQHMTNFPEFGVRFKVEGKIWNA